MLYLDKKAAETFFVAVLKQYHIGLIGDIGLCTYLNELYNLVDRQTVIATQIQREIKWHGGSLEDLSPEQEEGLDTDVELSVNYSYETKEKGDTEKNSVVLYFVMHGMKDMTKWEFHEHDDDPFPSVPHAHWERKDRPKLDPYTGRAYMYLNKEDTSKRLKRKQRIELWNNVKFREFVLRALDWYMLSHQHNISHLPLIRNLVVERKFTWLDDWV